jgi:hypothetical protein
MRSDLLGIELANGGASDGRIEPRARATFVRIVSAVRHAVALAR